MTATARALITHGLRCTLPAPLLRLSWQGTPSGVVPGIWAVCACSRPLS